jgi:uncharacterized protein (TIGR02271 family)
MTARPANYLREVMTVLTEQQLPEVRGAEAYNRRGDKLGKIGQVYLASDTRRPEFATVSTGLFGLKETFVPLAGAEIKEGRVVLPYDKDQIKDAPNIDPQAPGGDLTAQQEIELYDYYGISYSLPGESGLPEGSTGGTSEGRTGDTAGDSGGSTTGTRGQDAMTRSEEQLRAGTRTEETGKARLRKYVVTEQEQVTVPVTREEVRVEREPITGANREAATSGPDIAEAEHEVTLHADKPVVETEAVPVERVRLATDTVTEQETVTGEVRKERIETEGDRDR